jgi:hypothetical protein
MEKNIEVHVLPSEQEEAGIVEIHPQYFELSDRLRLCLEYEKYMHRNYFDYHALFIAFNDKYEAQVVMSNNRSPKDMKLLHLIDFDKVNKAVTDAG